MAKKLSKSEAQKQIEDFFKTIHCKTPKEVKKIKKLAMAHNIKLGEKRKLFCKKCYVPYEDFSLRVKNNMIKVVCGNCEGVGRWKVK